MGAPLAISSKSAVHRRGITRQPVAALVGALAIAAALSCAHFDWTAFGTQSEACAAVAGADAIAAGADQLLAEAITAGAKGATDAQWQTRIETMAATTSIALLRCEGGHLLTDFQNGQIASNAPICGIQCTRKHVVTARDRRYILLLFDKRYDKLEQKGGR